MSAVPSLPPIVPGTAVEMPHYPANSAQVPPSIPLNVKCKLGIGEATITWDPPEKDGGHAIVYYTIRSQTFGEDRWSRHTPPMTDEFSTLVQTGAQTGAQGVEIGPYATNKTVRSFNLNTCKVKELAQGRVYGFCVTAFNGTFTSEPSEWSNHGRPLVRMVKEAKIIHEAYQESSNQLHLGHGAYQGSYFLVKDAALGWSAEVIQGIRTADWQLVATALARPEANVNQQVKYDRDKIRRDRREFIYADVQMDMFDRISDLDKVTETGDTCLMVAIKYTDLAVDPEASVVQAILAAEPQPDFHIRNVRGKSAMDYAQRQGAWAVALMEKASAPDPQYAANVKAAWQKVEDEASGDHYFWNTLTNEVQYDDPNEEKEHNVHDLLQTAKAWKGW